jgi:DNA-binding MarR family transcriptional regulator
VNCEEVLVPGPHPLSRYTGYLLRRAFVRSTRLLRGCLPADGQIREWTATLIVAERGPLSQHDLGALAHVNRSLVVKLVDALEARSWVVRERSGRDRRTYALQVTDAGTDALEGIRGDLDRGEAALTRPLSDAEVRRLRTLLGQLLADDPCTSLTSLAGRTGYLVAQAHRVLRERAASRLEPLGLHPRHFGVLATVAEDQPCSQTHLAAGLGVSAPGVLPDLGDLEAAGLISRERNAEDRRMHDLRLTEDGQRLLRLARRTVTEVQDEIRQRLGPGGDEDLRRLLARLLD